MVFVLHARPPPPSLEILWRTPLQPCMKYKSTCRLTRCLCSFVTFHPHCLSSSVVLTKCLVLNHIFKIFNFIQHFNCKCFYLFDFQDPVIYQSVHSPVCHVRVCLRSCRVCDLCHNGESEQCKTFADCQWSEASHLLAVDVYLGSGTSLWILIVLTP